MNTTTRKYNKTIQLPDKTFTAQQVAELNGSTVGAVAYHLRKAVNSNTIRIIGKLETKQRGKPAFIFSR